MRKIQKSVATISLVLLSTAGVALAEEAKKPAGPTLSDVLDASGLTLTGYVDGTYSYMTTSPKVVPDSNTFALQQAAFTLAKQPTEGFGGLVNVIAGTDAPSLPGGTGSTSGFDVLQAFVQYASGKTTVMAGKFTTLAGAEVVAPTGNTNITRSVLFAFEPVTHTGLRLTYAASSMASFIIGVNNGWNVETNSPDKTVELGLSLTPSKVFALTAQAYYGKQDCEATGFVSNCTLLDLVATWNATPKLTLIGSVDYGSQDKGGGLTKSKNWSGYAAYLNYAINDAWRVSVRGEYFDDSKQYLTTAKKHSEGTVTFGFMPAKSFELRFEGRYDTFSIPLVKSPNTTQGWLQALYKF